MKWVFMTVLVIVAGAVGAFAIYTFGWRDGDDGASPEEERAFATVAAREVAAFCDPDCEVENLHKVAERVWQFQLSGGTCYVIHLDDFRPLADGKFTGGAPVPCA